MQLLRAIFGNSCLEKKKKKLERISENVRGEAESCLIESYGNVLLETFA